MGRTSSRTGGATPRGFTLVEIMVTVGIIGLLIGILVPSLQGARRGAKRVACGANLHQVGQALRMYLNQTKDFMPTVSYMPSMPSSDGTKRPSIAEVLSEQVSDQQEVFHCPADTPGATVRPEPNNGKSFYQTEGTSYVFNFYLNAQKLFEFVRKEKVVEYFGGQVAEEQIWVLRDYVTFHAKPGKPGAINYMYVDGHVGDLER